MMQFILFYEEYLNELFETMIGIQKQLEEIYKKNESLLKQLEKKFDIDWLVGNHRGIAKWCKSLAQIDVSFSFIQRHLLLGETYPYDQDRGWLILGIEYVDSIERNNKATIEIEKVCHALADEVRVKMVEIIRNENEINVASLAKILNLPISATAYHLDVLKKASILCYRMEGRVAFYWLNNTLLKLAGQKIQQLGEE